MFTKALTGQWNYGNGKKDDDLYKTCCPNNVILILIFFLRHISAKLIFQNLDLF